MVRMKRIHGKGRWLILIGALMALSTGMTAMASGNVKIRFENAPKNSWTEEVKEPKVTVNYSEESPEWSKSPEDWVPGKKITATFTVPGTYKKSECSVYGGELLSVSSADEETTIKASYVPVAQLGSPESAGWSDVAKTRASWKKVPYASKYQLRLYRDSIWLQTLTTSSTSLDLVKYLEDGYSYYYEVRAIAKNSSEEDYLKDGEFTISADSVVQELGETNGRWANYQDGKKYRDENGNYLVNSWQMIAGKWYYFNQEGYALTGWQYLGDKWYYMNGDAQMQTGWQQINGQWYYLNSGGDMVTGWVQAQPGKWYYLYSDGSMAVNTVVENIYQIDATGVWVQ